MVGEDLEDRGKSKNGGKDENDQIKFPENKGIWFKKWLIASVFLLATTSAFFGFLEVAPVGVFSEMTTQYRFDSPDQSMSDSEFVVNVTTSLQPNNGDQGLGVGRDGRSFYLLLQLVVLLYLPTLLAYTCCRAWSLNINKSRDIIGEQFKFSVGNVFLSSTFASIIYLITALILHSYSNLISGSLGATTEILFYLAGAFHIFSIFILFNEFGGRLVPSTEPRKLGIYMQRHGQMGQGALSIGLGVAIGGILTFARAGTSFAIPVLFIVGVVLLPLAGIAACRYYRIRQAELKYNR